MSVLFFDFFFRLSGYVKLFSFKHVFYQLNSTIFVPICNTISYSIKAPLLMCNLHQEGYFVNTIKCLIVFCRAAKILLVTLTGIVKSITSMFLRILPYCFCTVWNLIKNSKLCLPAFQVICNCTCTTNITHSYCQQKFYKILSAYY